MAQPLPTKPVKVKIFLAFSDSGAIESFICKEEEITSPEAAKRYGDFITKLKESPEAWQLCELPMVEVGESSPSKEENPMKAAENTPQKIASHSTGDNVQVEQGPFFKVNKQVMGDFLSSMLSFQEKLPEQEKSLHQEAIAAFASYLSTRGIP